MFRETCISTFFSFDIERKLSFIQPAINVEHLCIAMNLGTLTLAALADMELQFTTIRPLAIPLLQAAFLQSPLSIRSRNQKGYAGVCASLLSSVRES